MDKPFVVRQPTDTKAFSLFVRSAKENAQKYCVCFGVCGEATKENAQKYCVCFGVLIPLSSPLTPYLLLTIQHLTTSCIFYFHRFAVNTTHGTEFNRHAQQHGNFIGKQGLLCFRHLYGHDLRGYYAL